MAKTLAEMIDRDIKEMLREFKDKRADDPCWKRYKQIGMKKKNGKLVPNCVPTNSK